MKLIKINNDHYVVVDDSPIKEGDYCTTHLNVIDVGKIHNSYTIFNPQNKEHLDMVKCCKKITHSTLPLEQMKQPNKEICIGNFMKGQSKIQSLSIQEVKEFIGEVDVEKKYTEEDFMLLIDSIKTNNRDWDSYIGKGKSPLSFEENIKQILQSLQPKTEWEIEEIDGKFKLK